MKLSYKSQNLTPIFQIYDGCLPKSLDKSLAELDYVKQSETSVMIAIIEDQPTSENNLTQIEISTTLEEKWFLANQRILGSSDRELKGKFAIIERIKIPNKFFFSLFENNWCSSRSSFT